MKAYLTLSLCLLSLAAGVVPAIAQEPQPSLSYKFHQSEIPRWALLQGFLFIVPGLLENPGTRASLLAELGLDIDPRAEKILADTARRMLAYHASAKEFVVEEQFENGRTTRLIRGTGKPSSATTTEELIHEKELEKVRYIADIFNDLQDDLASIGLSAEGIDRYVEGHLRPSTSVLSDEPFVEGSKAWNLVEAFEQRLATGGSQ